MVIHCLWLLAAVDEDRTRLTGRLTLYFFSSPDFSKHASGQLDGLFGINFSDIWAIMGIHGTVWICCEKSIMFYNCSRYLRGAVSP